MSLYARIIGILRCLGLVPSLNGPLNIGVKILDRQVIGFLSVVHSLSGQRICGELAGYDSLLTCHGARSAAGEVLAHLPTACPAAASNTGEEKRRACCRGSEA